LDAEPAEPDEDLAEEPGAEVLVRALRLLAAREHSRRELARKLAARGFARGDIDPALDRLCASGALDESRVAERYVSERAGKGFGPLRIRAELAEKGLPESAYEPYLAQMQEDWPQLLAEAHERRFGPSAPTSRAEYARRGRFLEQRGFPVELIRRHLARHD
jgi:regulatory protein